MPQPYPRHPHGGKIKARSAHPDITESHNPKGGISRPARPTQVEDHAPTLNLVELLQSKIKKKTIYSALRQPRFVFVLHNVETTYETLISVENVQTIE